MTSTMLLKFLESNSDIEKACKIIMNSLPICKVRGISYSTFSAIDCYENGKAKIVEEGKPDELYSQNGLFTKMVDIQTKSDDWLL